MNRTTMLFMAAAMAIGVSAPANAEYVRLGSVDVGFRADSDTAYTRFGGRMESLRFTASRSDIFCRSIIVRYENGETQNVFSGRLDERSPVDVDLRGRARRVDSIRFLCRSNEFRGGKIFIAGEVGRYRDEWRRDRDWDRMWSGLFGGGMSGPGPGPRMGNDNDWVSLGRLSFQGRNDHDSTFAGWAGRHVDRIGLRPVDGDARCMSIVVTFDNGHKVKLTDGRVLERGRMNVYDLPGYERNLAKLYMRCRALGDYSVTIDIFVRK
jgi:hypothetical protein